MANQAPFDALELARLANAEIDDIRRMAQPRPGENQSVEPVNATTALLRFFRSLSKGG